MSRYFKAKLKVAIADELPVVAVVPPDNQIVTDLLVAWRAALATRPAVRSRVNDAVQQARPVTLTITLCPVDE